MSKKVVHLIIGCIGYTRIMFKTNCGRIIESNNGRHFLNETTCKRCLKARKK